MSPMFSEGKRKQGPSRQRAKHFQEGYDPLPEHGVPKGHRVPRLDVL